MEDVPKSIKRALRQIVGRAHEHALRQALTKLDEDFDRWRRGEIDSFDLTDRIHRFHNGPAREIYNRWATGPSSALPIMAALAIHEKLVEPSSVSPEALAYLQPRVEGARLLQGENVAP